jgi:hypothetical protein
MGKWDEMWRKQEEQQRDDFNLDPCYMNVETKSRVSKDLLLGAWEEMAEFSKEIGKYKPHEIKNRRIERVNILDGCVDVMKYAIAIAQLQGLSSGEVFDYFMEKSNVLSVKARGERLTLDKNTPVVLVDVDGIIADLSVWDEKIGEHSNVPINEKTVSMLESLKEDFYHDGGFRNLSPVTGAVDGMKELKERGWKLILLSARPYWQYKRVYADTVFWLDKHEIPYDLIIFNKDKAEAIYESVFPAMPSFMLEDRSKHAHEVAKLGIKVLLLDWPFNRGIKNTDMIERANGWDDILIKIGDAR